MKLGSDDSTDVDTDSDFEGGDASSSGSESYASDAEASDEEFHGTSDAESDGLCTTHELFAILQSFHQHLM